MENTVKVLIFDMDGVILNSEPLHQKAREIMYRKYGVHTESDFPDPVGKSSSEFWEQIGKLCGRTWDACQMEQEQYRLVYKQVVEDRIPATQNLRGVLQWAKGRDLRIGLASSSSRALVDGVLDALKLKDYFDCVVSGDKVYKKKPDPELYISILKYMEICPEEAVAIEDSNAGIKSAKAAGIPCLAYLNPSSGNQNLAEADQIITDMAEIIDVLSAFRRNLTL